MLYTGDIPEARVHLEQAIALYDPAKHRSLATRFGQDARVHALSYLSWALWFLGYPEAALAASHRALSNAREIGQAATLMTTLTVTTFSFIFCGDHAAANARVDELAALADEKDAALWGAWGMLWRGLLFGLTGRTSDVVQMLTSGIATWRETGATYYLPSWLSYLAEAHAELGQLEEAWGCIGEAARAIEITKERHFQAEANRIAGEIALKSSEPDTMKAQVYFERALAVARQQHAKSWELRASMSLARLWRDQGKVQQARELLAPVYGWFTEGFDTRDLKDAKTLLEELASGN
jgi:predicted ATPase